MVITHEELVALYLHTYTKTDLAEKLAAATLDGDLPPLPTERPQVLSFPRGRPSLATKEHKWGLLAEAIMENYPTQVDTAYLAATSGMLNETVTKLQTDLEFLIRLNAPFNTYFAALPQVSKSRLTSAWRGVLDLHNYKSAIEDPGIRLPFYRMHIVMWAGVSIKLDIATKALNQRDANERRRIKCAGFNNILKAAGWPKVSTQTHPYVDNGTHPWTCDTHCPIGKAFVQKADIYTIAATRELLGDLDWLPQRRTFIDARTAHEAIRQIIGLE
jgi:hypothetical protein